MTLDEFLKHWDVAARCETKKIFDRLMKLLDDKGYRWAEGQKATEYTPPLDKFPICVSMRCYEETCNRIVYDDEKRYKNLDYAIVSACELMNDNKKSPKRFCVVIDSEDGKETIARLIIDGRVVKEAKTRYNPKDKFSVAKATDVAIGRLFEKKEKDLKIGDTVKIRKDLKPKEYGGVLFVRQMLKFCGKTAKIDDVWKMTNGKTAYTIDNFSFSREMFEK